MRGWLASLASRAGTVVQPTLLATLILIPSAAIAQTGTVTGTVTDSSTGLPIANATVQVFTYSLQQVATAATNASGVYTVANVPPGALYYVRATVSSGYVDEWHPDVKAFRNVFSQTLLSEASPISVAGGAVVPGIDFALDPDGRISGTVTNAAGGAPIANVFVGAYTVIGSSVSFAGTGFTDGAGAYTIQGLPSGTYYLLTSNNAGFANEIYDNIPCVGFCATAAALMAATPVPATAGATTSGRHFALETGGRISGIVTNAATGQPAPNVPVSAALRSGSSIFTTSASTNAMGEYTIQGLAAGAYGVYTGAGNLTNEVHDNILCPLSCLSNTAVDSGADVAVALGATTSGVNFSLDPGGSISGTVTDEVTGLPAANVGVFAVVRVGNSTLLRGALTTGAGVYTIQGLPAGSYALLTNTSLFANEIYNNIPCPGFCSSSTAFDTGTLVPVTAGATAGGRDFALQPVAVAGSGAITGTLTDAVSGLPIAGVSVQVLTQLASGGTAGFTVTTNVAGVYSAAGLTPGTYYAVTTGNHTFRNEVFDGIPCLNTFCPTANVLAGTPIAVSSGASTTANFALSKADGLTGAITDAATGLPLVGVTVSVYHSPSGVFAGSTTSNASGAFFVRGLPNGTYVAYTSNSLGYRNEIYNNVPCATNCSSAIALASGTPIVVTGAAAFADGAELVTGINFALDTRTGVPAAPSNLRIVTSGGTGQFTWTAPSLFSAAAPTSYLLEAGGSPGTTFITLPVPGTGTSFSVPGVPPGTYYVRLRAVNASGAGPASNEVMLVVGAGGTGLPDAPTNLVAFISGNLLTMTWSPAAGGGPPSGFIVEAGSASGASNIATLPVAGASFSYSPVPAGFYFLRVRARNAAGVSAATSEVMVVAGNAPAPPGAPNFSGHSVSAGTVTLNWVAPAQGAPTSYIIEAGSAPGLSNLATVNTGTTAVTASFSGVPPGTYYVRVRAVNAQGASVVSNERTIVVS